MQTISVKTGSRREMLDVTGKVKKAAQESGIKDGLVVCYVPHTTAGITINEGADPSVTRDILDTLGKLAPAGAGYKHAEGNADSHIQATLAGSSATVILEKGALVLGAWQSIFFCEFDGPRSRKLHVEFMPK